MQIFILDNDIELCAKYHADTHVISGIKEQCQMLATCHKVLGTWKIEMPLPTHVNHPCNIWIRQSLSNYLWTTQLTLELCEQFKLRRNKLHAYDLLAEYFYQNPPHNLKDIGLTPFALAMPDIYKSDDPVESYRNYYIGDKSEIASWSTEVPYWFTKKLAA